MKYITISDLSETIRKNIWKIPRDIDYIVGIPRSGMIAASIICSYLNVPLIDINSFIAGMPPYGGRRLRFFTSSHKPRNKVLVVDDTVFGGGSMNNAKYLLSNINDKNLIYMCVYLEGPGKDSVDIYLEDVRMYTNENDKFVLYEWNILQHNEAQMGQCLFDIDGVFCVDPPDERNELEYLSYIKNAIPLFIPRTPIGGIVTYRLEKNRYITEKWLHDNGVSYNELIMFDAMSWDERNKRNIPPEKYKADFYKQHDNYKLFVESNDYQAKRISEISGKPVYCVESNKLYQ
jgi:uncharacterized HAD superfamily protein/hypoxanthine-guanine phosphoribosyltransferase